MGASLCNVGRRLKGMICLMSCGVYSCWFLSPYADYVQFRRHDHDDFMPGCSYIHRHRKSFAVVLEFGALMAQ